jgi:pyruvate dehydrogenase E1 component alpha subunit
VIAVEAAARSAAEAVRTGPGPRFLELHTYRFRAHSMADPDLYRAKEEVEHWKERDPIALFEARLRKAKLLADEDLAGIESHIAAELDEAIVTAESAPLEPLEDLTKDVYTVPVEIAVAG